jgi:chromate transporter
MQTVQWLPLFAHFLSLSLLAIGGAITTTPEMHRYLVTQTHWISHVEFSNSIALAQAAPGPNISFVALIGWHLGGTQALQTGESPVLWGLWGAVVCMIGILFPSSALTWVAGRWAQIHRSHLLVRSFKAGMAPIAIGLLASTAWLLGNAPDISSSPRPAALWALSLVTLCLSLRTRVHMLWLLGAGAAGGWMGWF